MSSQTVVAAVGAAAAKAGGAAKKAAAKHGDEHAKTEAHADGHAGDAAPTLYRKKLPSTPKPLDIDFWLALWTLLLFLGLMYVLQRFAFGPIIASLTLQRTKMDAAVREAELARSEAQQLSAEHEAELRRIYDETKQVLEKARIEANQQGDALLAQVKSETSQRRDQALAELETARIDAMNQIRGAAKTLSRNAAEKVVGRAIDAKVVDAVARETMR